MQVQFGLLNLGDFTKVRKEAGQKGVTLRDNETGDEFTTNSVFELQSLPPRISFRFNPLPYPKAPENPEDFTEAHQKAFQEWIENDKPVSKVYPTRFVPGGQAKWEKAIEKYRNERDTMTDAERDALQIEMDACFEIPELDLIG